MIGLLRGKVRTELGRDVDACGGGVDAYAGQRVCQLLELSVALEADNVVWPNTQQR